MSLQEDGKVFKMSTEGKEDWYFVALFFDVLLCKMITKRSITFKFYNKKCKVSEQAGK